MLNTVAFDPMSAIFQAVPAGNPVQVPVGTSAEMELLYAFVESEKLTSRYSQRKRFVVVGAGPSNEPLVRDETLAGGWVHSPAP